MFGIYSTRMLGTMLFALGLTSTAHAQTVAQGYGVVGNGRYSNRFASGPLGGTFAFGGEVLARGQFGGSVEGGLDGVAPTFSIDGLLALRHARQRIVPFIRAGFTHSSGEYSNTYDGPNAGGGVTFWLNPRVGIRAEYLHVVRTLSGTSLWTENSDVVRMGVSFR